MLFFDIPIRYNALDIFLFCLFIVILSPFPTILHENGIKVKRKDVRNYLDRDKMYAKTSDKSNYRARYKRALIQQKQGIIPDYKEEQKRLNKNYLVYVSIEMLNKKKIKYSKEMKNIVGKVPSMGYVSP